jgi:hypothetical protein
MGMQLALQMQSQCVMFCVYLLAELSGIRFMEKV